MPELPSDICRKIGHVWEEEQWIIIRADIGQEEPRIGAFLSGDEALAAAIDSGDMYLVAAAMAYHKDAEQINREERQIGKRMFMAWLNRAGPRGIQTSAYWLSTDEAKGVLRYLSTRFHRFEAWSKQTQAELRRVGSVRTYFGRKVTFPQVWTQETWVVLKAERSSIPARIQGTAADIIKMVMVKMDEPVRELGAQMILNVHDEICVETPLDKREEVIELCKEMTAGMLPIHLPVEISWGYSWGKAEGEVIVA